MPGDFARLIGSRSHRGDRLSYLFRVLPRFLSSVPPPEGSQLGDCSIRDATLISSGTDRVPSRGRDQRHDAAESLPVGRLGLIP